MWRPVPSVWPVPYLWWRQLKFGLAMLGLLALGIVGWSMSSPALHGTNGWLVLLTGPAWMMPGLVVMIVDLRWVGRMRARAREVDGCLCLRCAYPIAGPGEEGVCPECGEAFRLAESRTKWRAALRLDEW